MRILQVIPSLGVGGAERVLGLLVHHLRRSGHALGVVSLYGSVQGAIEAELRREGAELFFLGKHRGPDLRMVPRLARATRSFRPDVVHSHSTHVLRYLLGSMPPWSWRRVVHTLHNVAEHEADRPGRILQQVAFRSGVAAVAIGDAVARSMGRVYRRAPRRTIPNGIPVADYARDPSARLELRASLAIPAGVPAFLAVGRFKAQKDHATLVRAFASPRLGSLAARLLLAGDGELSGAVQRQVDAAGIGARVHFLGARTDVPRVLAAADAFVLSSRYEGNPLCVMEAMAAGLPVVATAVGCVPELVTRTSGRLVPPGDPAALADAMVELAADGALRQELGAAAERLAREHFDALRMAEAYEELYRELA